MTVKRVVKGALVGFYTLLTALSSLATIPAIVHAMATENAWVQQNLPPHVIVAAIAAAITASVAIFFYEVTIREGKMRKVVLAVAILGTMASGCLIFFPFNAPRTELPQANGVAHGIGPAQIVERSKSPASRSHRSSKTQVASDIHGTATEGATSPVSNDSGAEPLQEPVATSSSADTPEKGPCGCDARAPVKVEPANDCDCDGASTGPPSESPVIKEEAVVRQETPPPAEAASSHNEEAGVEAAELREELNEEAAELREEAEEEAAEEAEGGF
jgi:hypothetical protein